MKCSCSAVIFNSLGVHLNGSDSGHCEPGSSVNRPVSGFRDLVLVSVQLVLVSM